MEWGGLFLFRSAPAIFARELVSPLTSFAHLVRSMLTVSCSHA